VDDQAVLSGGWGSAVEGGACDCDCDHERLVACTIIHVSSPITPSITQPPPPRMHTHTHRLDHTSRLAACWLLQTHSPPPLQGARRQQQWQRGAQTRARGRWRIKTPSCCRRMLRRRLQRWLELWVVISQLALCCSSAFAVNSSLGFRRYHSHYRKQPKVTLTHTPSPDRMNAAPIRCT